MSALVYLIIGAGFGAVVGMLMMAVITSNNPIRDREDAEELRRAIERVSRP